MPGDRSEAEAVVRHVFPGYEVAPEEESTLDVTYPPDDITQVALLPGAELLCDRRLVLDRPSELPGHLLRAGAGRRIVMHGMHSVVDWLCFAVWEDGKLIRSLSLFPDGGIEENIGEPYDFERPYWDGLHPVEPMPEWEDEEQATRAAAYEQASSDLGPPRMFRMGQDGIMYEAGWDEIEEAPR